MSNLIGKISKCNWKQAPSGATHIRQSGNNSWYKIHDDSICVFSFGAWSMSAYDSIADHNMYTNDKLISKEEDLKMDKVAGVKDLKEGTLVIAEDGDKGFVKGDKIVWMSFSNSNFSYYTNFNHENSPNLSIVAYSDGDSFSASHRFFKVFVETESDLKIRELEQTINSASDTLKEAQKQLQQLKVSK